MEYRIHGVSENWSIGVMEYWSVGQTDSSFYHYSSTPGISHFRNSMKEKAHESED
jgi:hypothetical protein